MSDLQASALTPARGTGAVTVAAPREPGGVQRRRVRDRDRRPAVDRGRRRGDGATRRATTRPACRSRCSWASAGPGRRSRRPTRPVTLAMTVPERGWVPLVVELAPDELRGDDRWSTVVRVAPPARVRWDPADRYLAAAFDVLRDGGRVVPGRRSHASGSLGPGPSLVLPPADPAQVGAVNRALAARGVSWQFGALVTTAGSTDSSRAAGPGAVARRYDARSSGSGETGVLLRAARRARGWCGAGTSCWSGAVSIRRGPRCPSPPDSSRSSTPW